MPHWLHKVVTLLTADTGDLRELAKIAGEDPQTFYLGIDPKDLDLQGQDTEGMGFGSAVSHQIRQIRRARSKGERLCMLLDLLLRDRTKGMEVLEGYQFDRSKYASMSLAALRAALSQESESNLLGNVELVRIIRKPFAHEMPSSRASFMYYLVKHLSKYPDIKDYLKQSWARTTSSEYNRYRDQIEEILSKETGHTE